MAGATRQAAGRAGAMLRLAQQQQQPAGCGLSAAGQVLKPSEDYAKLLPDVLSRAAGHTVQSLHAQPHKPAGSAVRLWVLYRALMASLMQQPQKARLFCHCDWFLVMLLNRNQQSMYGGTAPPVAATLGHTAAAAGILYYLPVCYCRASWRASADQPGTQQLLKRGCISTRHLQQHG
jgi:hypothetical protein